MRRMDVVFWGGGINEKKNLVYKRLSAVVQPPSYKTELMKCIRLTK